MTMSSAEKLACNLHGPSTGCVGTLHTYMWEPPKTSCLFWEVREAQGLFAPTYFAAEKEQLFYELKGSQTLPMSCCGYQVYATKVQEIMLLRTIENKDMKLLPFPLMTFPMLPSWNLSLSLLGVQVGHCNRAEECSGVSSVLWEQCERAFWFSASSSKRGDIVYEYTCQEVTVKLIESKDCFSNIPIHPVKKNNYLSMANQMLKASAAKEPCTHNFLWAVKGKSIWIQIGPKLKSIPGPRSLPRKAINLSHHGDELGLYTEVEECNFDHILGLRYYAEQVTTSLIHAVCKHDAGYELNPLPGSPFYSLSKLEQETKDFVTLEAYEYFL